MYITIEIEYQDANGEWDSFEVVFEADPCWENDGIGHYEYWGCKCFDKGYNYVSLEYNGDPTWDESKYTEEQNDIIQKKYSDRKWLEGLCQSFCQKFADHKY